MKKLLVFLVFGLILYLTNSAYAEESYVINIPTGAGSPQAPYFWQSEKDGDTQGNIDVAVGDTVTWMNADTVEHTIVSGNPTDGPDGIFDSGLVKLGGSYSYTFYVAGKYDYFCSIHPWMTGVVTANLVYQKIPHVGDTIGDGTKTFDIEYLFDRLVTVNSIEPASKSIMFELVGKTDALESELVLRLPTGLIDGPFTVWIDGISVDYEQSIENDINVLKIPVSSFSKLVTVSGTHIVPEFGSYVVVLLVISTIFVIYFSKSGFPTRLRF